MFLGSKEAVLMLIQRLTDMQPESKPLRIAVAFWGDGAQSVVVAARKYQIICNLTSGGTNPTVIRALLAMPNVKVRHLAELHAKVVVADKQAIVGSANFSADGLGLNGSEHRGWLEAAAVIEANAVEHWFETHWRRAGVISDDALSLAEQAWANRTQSQSSGATDDCQPGTIEPVPQMSELDLFKPAITGGNMIRMAARPIELIYFQEIEPETKRSVWNPAYAVSLLWTTAGNRIRTKIEHCPYFESPSDVLERAKHAKTIEKVHRFVSVLSNHPEVSPEIRYWACQYLRRAT